ncbi:hypothetical protein FXO38_22259 [Capsicum annuum]|nr:hypothetical protein FXO37_27006 [Capsicum annuum]KAF3640165.1 hypothetical protein FXO38_22259 [Capsicum annuum]
MQSNSTSIDAPEILNAINITSVQESTYVDSNAEVADMVKSHFDSELPVLGVGDKIPQYVFPDVLSSDSIDATELKFSPLFLSEAEVLIECSDNLISFCNSYKLLGISLENSFLYFLDRAAISRVERYAINQFRHVRANCKRDISMERYIFENANVFSGNFRSYIYLLSDNMARATTLSLLIELCSSEQVEPGLPLRLPFDFRYKIGNFTRQINLELVISQPARILEWIDSLKGWTSLSPRQEQVEGISMLVGQIEGLSDYDYDSCVVYVPNSKFLSRNGPTHVKYWERYTGLDLVKGWRKHLDIILPILVTSIWNRTEHNNLYEAISKNIQFGILLATNSLALSYVVLEHSIMDLVAKLAVGLTHVFGLSMSLSYLTVDVVSHILIFAYTTILVIFIKTKYSFQNITVMQEYVKDPSKFTTITLAPVPATFCDPYGTQTWRKPLETTDAEEKEKQYSMISSKDVLTHHPRCHVSQYKFHFCKAEIFVENYSRSWNHFSSFMCTCNWWHIKLSYLEKTWMQLLWLLNDAFPWISSKLVLKVPIRWGASWITEILHVLMPPIQTALEESDPTINSDLNSKLHQVFNVCPLVLPSKELFGDYLVRCGCIL